MPSPTGLIQAALGDPIDKVAAASTDRLDLSRLHDDDLLLIDRPVRFAYRGDRGFEPPPTKFLGLTLIGGTVTGIEYAPQLDYLDLAGARALFDQVVGMARGAGWQPSADRDDLTGPEELAVMAADRTLPVSNAWHLERLAAEAKTLLFRLERKHADAYLLNLVWRDDALGDRLYPIVRRLREQDGKDVQITRPIDSSYPARVQALLATSAR